jgi:hypothetical protein
MSLSKQALICLGRYRVAAQAEKDLLARYRQFSDKFPLGTDVPELERPALDKLLAEHKDVENALNHSARLLAHYVSEDCGV